MSHDAARRRAQEPVPSGLVRCRLGGGIVGCSSDLCAAVAAQCWCLPVGTQAPPGQGGPSGPEGGVRGSINASSATLTVPRSVLAATRLDICRHIRLSSLTCRQCRYESLRPGCPQTETVSSSPTEPLRRRPGGGERSRRRQPRGPGVGCCARPPPCHLGTQPRGAAGRGCPWGSRHR